MIDFTGSPKLREEDLPEPRDFESFHPFIKGVFSQWHHTPFEIDSIGYVCAEQYMMASKASLCGDEAILDQIMQTEDPALHKRLGSQIRRFDHEAWDRWRFDVVTTANSAKFEQNAGAARQLRNTAPTMLVEANPRDWNWGNGLQISDPANQDPAQWRGTNYLGRILTMIRRNMFRV
ncbi:MAG: NADAR family protein [Erythrobacter sp.]|nr:NADAR family protein [Erythrobacter sp.]